MEIHIGPYVTFIQVHLDLQVAPALVFNTHSDTEENGDNQNSLPTYCAFWFCFDSKKWQYSNTCGCKEWETDVRVNSVPFVIVKT
jgi:hypothetical protein